MYTNKTTQFTRIYMDINHTCNARCRFCINDWSDNREWKLMSKEQLAKIIPLVDLLGGVLLFSCLYEPTVHPEFKEMLQMLPAAFKQKGMLTTNLVKKLSEDEIHAMAYSNLQHINISFESLSLEKHMHLSQVKKSAFFDNLDRLVKKCRKSNMPLTYTTMILKDNYDELVDIAIATRDKNNTARHEFRTPYYSALYDDYVQNQLLSRKQLDTLSEKLTKASPYVLAETKMDELTYKEMSKSLKNHPIKDPIEFFDKASGDIYSVRINSNGECSFMDDTVVNIDDMESPETFFKEKLIQFRKQEAENYLLKKNNFNSLKELPPILTTAQLEIAELYDERFMKFIGWSAFTLPEYKRTAKYISCKIGDKKQYYRLNPIERKDIEKKLGPDIEVEGFTVFVDLQPLGLENNSTLDVELVSIVEGEYICCTPISQEYIFISS